MAMDAPSLPASVEGVVQRLLGVGVPTYIVGGALRDEILDRPVRDYDLFVEGSLEVVARELPGAKLIGSANPVVALPAREGRPRIEISAARAGASSLEQDLAMRDFTVNAIAFDPARSTWLDPLGGRDDLAAGRLRASDPRRAFADDPVRIARGIRLATELGLHTDPNTAREMVRNAWRLLECPGERLRDELFRVLRTPDPRAALAGLHECGALGVILPEALRSSGIAAEHLSDDLFRYSLEICARVRPDPVQRLAALLHTCAVVDCKRYLAGRERWVFLRPHLRTAFFVRAASRRLRWSRHLATGVERRIRHIGLASERWMDDAAIRRMLWRVGRDILEDVLELGRAELELRCQESGGDEIEHALKIRTELELRIRALNRNDAEHLAIGGKEIMQEFSIPEGPEVQRWLMRARRRVWTNPEDNTRARILDWLRAAFGEER